MRMTVLFFLIIIFCSYNQITEIGVQSFDVNVARQENPSVWDMTTYKVEYIDPWTGDYDFVESQSSGSGNLWSRVYIMV